MAILVEPHRNKTARDREVAARVASQESRISNLTLDSRLATRDSLHHRSVFTYPLCMSDRNRHISFRSDRNVRPSGRLWNPAADVYRTRDGWTVKIDLAGVRPDEIEI